VDFADDGLPLTFGNDADALFTLSRGTVITDRSACGRLRVSGRDRLKFLHGQSTADIQALTEGQGCDACFTTAQGRIIDLVRVLVQPSSVILITSPGMGATLLERLQRFILYGDEVEVSDISGRTALFTVAGPAAPQLLAAVGAAAAGELSVGRHALLQCGGSPVIVSAGGALGDSDFTLLADEAISGDLWHSLTSQGAVPMGANAWDQAAVLAGRPSLGRELTQQYNPLEAGLFSAVSLAKGCYVGQETIAKVAAKGVAKQLWGLQMTAPAEKGTSVTADGRTLGTLTSAAVSEDGATWAALAYLLCREKGQQVLMEGRAVQVDGQAAKVVDAPFLSRQFAPGAAPLVAAAAPKEPSPTDVSDEDAAAAKERRLQEMQARLAAWQAEQQG